MSMLNLESIRKCNCPMDCSHTRYSFSVHTNKIDAEQLCSNQKFLFKMKNGLDQRGFYYMPPKFIDRYEQIMYGKDTSDKLWCIERVKKLAIVNFQIGNQIMTKIKRTQRVTFADTLANIGN